MLQVHRRPLVGVLSTGDELVEPSTQQLQAGQIRDANRPMLLAAARQAGAKTSDLGIARDTQEHVEASFNEAASRRVDVLLTTGERHWTLSDMHNKLSIAVGILCAQPVVSS